MLVWTFSILMERSPWKHFLLILKLDYKSVHVKSKYQICTLLFSCIDWPWSSDAIWWQKFGSTLAQVMAWHLRASSNYLNQCWLTIKGVLCHSSESSFTRGAHELNPQHVFKDYISFKLLPHTTGANDLTNDAYMRQWSNHQWFRQWLVTWSAPSHYLNQCWNIVNSTLKKRLQ